MGSEIEEIARRYERRKSADIAVKYSTFSPFPHYLRCEREFWYGKYLTEHFGSLEGRSILEIGAGGGDNLIYMLRLGFRVEDIWANELLPERLDVLRKRRLFLESNVVPGNAGDIDFEKPFDVVFQSTVFSSILDPQLQKQVANRMWSWLKPGGICLWYDFVYNNPWNKDVTGMPWTRVRSLFPSCSESQFTRVTLAPPIGRRVGRLYPYLNWPFLRTHIVGVLKK